mgnify:CR=1 FL=1
MAASHPATDPAGLGALPPHMQLLVVDDDEVDRERVLRLLGRTALNFDAMEAATSADALQLLRLHEFDCVMLDNHLGDASGAALLPAIRQATRRACPGAGRWPGCGPGRWCIWRWLPSPD